MIATVNGKKRKFAQPPTIAELLAELGVGQPGVAVARNERVIPRSELASERLAEGDVVEIIGAAAGG